MHRYHSENRKHQLNRLIFLLHLLLHLKCPYFVLSKCFLGNKKNEQKMLQMEI